MLEFILGVIVGGVIMGIVMGMIMKSRKSTVVAAGKNYANESEKQKEENLAKLREFIYSTDKKITNDLVQAELGISDATATRYLDELEKQGIIKQVGREGKYCHYEKI